MPIGNVSREAPKRDTVRPPWVKEKDTDALPAWTQSRAKLKPVEPKKEPFQLVKPTPVEEPTPAVKTLKPTLKKQATIKDKVEDKVEVEEKLVKPSQAKLNDRGKAAEQRSKFAKSALKSIETIPKLEDKLSHSNNNTEKPAPKSSTFKTVRLVDAKPQEKSVTIADKKSEKNGPTNNVVNDKPLLKTVTNDKNSVKNTPPPNDNKDKPVLKTTNTLNKTQINDKQTTNSIADKKPLAKTTVKPKEEEKETSKMATKPPTPMDKKLPPRKPSLAKQPSKDDVPVKKWRDPLMERKKENIDKAIANEIPKGHTLTKNESLRSLLKPTPPPMPPPPPNMPPPPDFKKAPLDPAKLKKLEQLKSRPRRRPDWSDMMKEVESGKKLKHVVCNDRSSPIIKTEVVVKNKGQFIFESETPTSHNDLLKEINKGIKLKKVKTNDRSKPILEGLRKFRRQMTIEEQVQKSMSQANLAASPSGASVAEMAMAPQEEEEIDEMDDIDKVRDDLQSTKQLLAIELRNKEAQERENKRLLTRIQNLEAELARERAIIKQEQKKTVISVTDAYDERLVNNLKAEVEKTKENADSLEKRYLDAAEARDDASAEVEELKRKNAELERKLELALSSVQFEDVSEEPLSFYKKRQLEFEKECRFLGVDPTSPEAYNMRKRNSISSNNASNAAFTNSRFDYEDDEGIVPTNANSRRSSHAIRQLSLTKGNSFEEEEESEPEEEESEEKKQKRMEKEVKNIRSKIRLLKEKQDNMKRERMGYKLALKNQQAALKDEKRKYKELKREVDKMAKMMKECGSDDDEDDEDEDEESEEEKKSESEEEETETETEQDTESETESESEPEDAPVVKKKENLSTRLKRHEGRINALKKGNALLVANVDRLKDDVLKQREESAALKNELDSLVDGL